MKDMKKEYIKPEMQVVTIQQQSKLLAGSGGDGARVDDPQPPGSALAREFDIDMDDDW